MTASLDFALLLRCLSNAFSPSWSPPTPGSSQPTSFVLKNVENKNVEDNLFGVDIFSKGGILVRVHFAQSRQNYKPLCFVRPTAMLDRTSESNSENRAGHAENAGLFMTPEVYKLFKFKADSCSRT